MNSNKNPNIPNSQIARKKMEEKFFEDVAIIANSRKVSRIILLSFLKGAFTALGATAGFALLAFVTVRAYDAASDLPLLEQIFESIGAEKAIRQLDTGTAR